MMTERASSLVFAETSLERAWPTATGRLPNASRARNSPLPVLQDARSAAAVVHFPAGSKLGLIR